MKLGELGAGPIVCHRNNTHKKSKCLVYRMEFFSFQNVKSHVTRALGIRRLRMLLFLLVIVIKLSEKSERCGRRGERQESKWHIVRFIHVNMCHFLCAPFAENDEKIKSIPIFPPTLLFFLIFRYSGGFPPFSWLSLLCAVGIFSFHSHLVKNALVVQKHGGERAEEGGGGCGWTVAAAAELECERIPIVNIIREQVAANFLAFQLYLLSPLCCHSFPIVQIDTSTCACFKYCSSGRRVVDEWICAES